METNIKDTIEQYVRGKMSAVEAEKMEALIKSDAKVANEVALQKTISSTIKKNRIAALKARLNKIPVSSGMEVSSTSSTFTAMKAASVILASAGLSLGVYFYVQNNTANEESVSTTVETNETLVSKESPKLPEERIAVVSSSEPKSEEINSNSAPTEVKKSDKKAFSLFKSKSQSKKVPNLDSFDDDSQASVTADEKEINSDTRSINSQLVSSDVDIKNVQDGSHKFHYKLQENTLFLYGNFDASPYEILEFNGKTTDQVLYLYYDKSYFAMTPTTHNEINKLKKITDTKLLSNLENARSR